MQLLEFIPLYMHRVWGGGALQSKLGRELSAGEQIGESWEIVDRPDHQSVVANGALAGQTLRELIVNSGAELLGPDYDPAQPFPILVKWLNCQESLSLQVHPPDKVARQLNGEAKTEHWYIADASDQASIIAGLLPGITKERFEDSLTDGTIDEYVQPLQTNKGDSILIESGCIHAINAGNLILEIQQNSDTTYRLHDWGRIGLDGKHRQLHTQEALRSIDFERPRPEINKAEENKTLLADCGKFRIRKFDLAPGDTPLCFPSGKQARLFHVVSGSLCDRISGQQLQFSKNYLQPYITELALISEVKTTILVTDQFSG